ncbi:hypothetical protein [Magnetococcus sp. PR-3]|uniref:hypothetical protein n=1 Tax=Magnetococcus sp. PR-3 TaxID=3120355 RepID=UPI002FCDFF2C
MRHAAVLGGSVALMWLVSALMILGWQGLSQDMGWVVSIFALLFASGTLMHFLIGFMGGQWDGFDEAMEQPSRIMSQLRSH